MASKTQARIILGLIGLMEGLALWWLGRDMATLSNETVRSVVFAVVLSTGVCLQLTWGSGRPRTLILCALACGACVCGPAIWVLSQVRSGLDSDDFRLATFIPSVAATVMVFVLFLQSAQAPGPWRARYPVWLQSLATAIFSGAGGFLLMGLYWLLVSLWAGLFKLLNISFFWNVFYSVPFACLTLPVAWSLGLALARENMNRVLALGTPFLPMLRLLLVMISVIGLLFLITLPVAGLAPLWATRMATPLLLGLIGLGILFLNLSLREGAQSLPYSMVEMILIRAFALSLPVFAALALYAVSLRIQQHGLMPERIWAILLAGAALLLGCGYGASALDRRGAFIGLVPVWNMSMALVATVVGLVVHTPLMDPLALSTRNQVHRLLSGREKATSFDFGALKFKLGQVGKTELAALETLPGLPEADAVRAQLERLKQSTSYWDWADRAGLNAVPPIRLLTGDGKLPDALIAALRASPHPSTKMCLRSEECFAFQVDLNGDGSAEYVLGLPHLLNVFGQTHPNIWDRVGELRPSVTGVTKAQLSDAIQRGAFQRVAPVYSNLTIGETAFQFIAPSL